MANVSLVIMAAGMGSRFGGLKQLEPIGPNGETLIDYAVYDAYQLGIREIILVVRKAFHEQVSLSFKEKWKLYKDLKLTFINQELNDVPSNDLIDINREKPWGTTHVLYVLRNHLKNSFIVMNADDYYGKEALSKLYNHLKTSQDPNEQAMVSFKLRNTLSSHGGVTRGVCIVENNLLKSIQETKNLKLNDKQEIESDSGNIEANSLVSMNLWGFHFDFLKYVLKDFQDFLKTADLNHDESLLPVTIQKYQKSGAITVHVLTSSQDCLGMTFKEDLPKLKSFISSKIADSDYPQKIF